MNAPLTRRSLLGATAALGAVALPAAASAVASATADVPEPEALFVHGNDFWMLGCVVPKRRWKRGRLTYGFDEVVAQIQALTASEHERRRAERRDEVVAAWDRWQADMAAARDVSGETAADQHYQQACAEHEAFLLRLVHLRTADPDVMRVKAAAVLNIWSGDADRFDHAVDRAVKADEDVEHPLCFSLMRDMLHGLGAEYRVSL